MKKQFNFRIPIDVLEKIQVLSEREYRTTSQMIIYILKKYIREYESKNGEIQCGRNIGANASRDPL